MRTRDVCMALRRRLGIGQYRNQKLDILEVMGRMERCELQLRQLRLIAHHLLGVSVKRKRRVTSSGVKVAQEAKEEEFEKRMEALRRIPRAPDRQSASQGDQQ